MKLFVFGYGYTGRALARRLDWEVAATARTEDQAATLKADGVTPVEQLRRHDRRISHLQRILGDRQRDTCGRCGLHVDGDGS